MGDTDQICVWYDASSKHPWAGVDDGAWQVWFSINDGPKEELLFRDPFRHDQYEYFDQYATQLGDVLRYRKRTEACGPRAAGASPDSTIQGLHACVQRYGNDLAAALGLYRPEVIAQLRSTVGEIFIREKEAGPAQTERDQGWQPVGSSIHRIHWELLETADLPSELRRRNYHIRVTREIVFGDSDRGPNPSLPAASLLGDRNVGMGVVDTNECLADVQQDPDKTFKILLVLARKFVEPSDGSPIADMADPHLALWLLMHIQHKLSKRIGRGRLMVDVVRPTSADELRRHLARRNADGIIFNLVHFDVHGGLVTERGRQNYLPVLYFTQEKGTEGGWSELETSPATTVASILAEHHVENVIMNSCLSASTRYGRHANVCRVFVEAGVGFALGMWPPVNQFSVEVFLACFYQKLLVDCLPFEAAAQSARESLRSDGSDSSDERYLDGFFCVQYARVPRKARLARPENRSLRSRFSRHLSRSRSSRELSLRFLRSSRDRSDTISPPTFGPIELTTLGHEVDMAPAKTVHAYDADYFDDMLRRVRGMAQIPRRTNLVAEALLPTSPAGFPGVIAGPRRR